MSLTLDEWKSHTMRTGWMPSAATYAVREDLGQLE